MGTKLEEILEASQKGYIDSKSEVDEIIPRMANMKLNDFAACRNREELLQDIKIIMESHNMSTRNLDTVTYREILCLLDSIPELDEVKYAMDSEERAGLRTEYTAIFRCSLLSAGKRVGAVKLFLAVTVKAFASSARIPDFDKVISVIRSREISVSLILQSMTQLESMYTPALRQ